MHCVGRQLFRNQRIFMLNLSTSTSLPSFYDLEHKNWQRGVEAYNAGFGSLTVQTIPTLLRHVASTPDCSGGLLNFLDVATGPGYVVSEAYKRMDKGLRGRDQCQFAALDFSQHFLDLAKQRLTKDLGPDHSVELVLGDAQSLPFDDQRFDAICCNYGILHLGNPDRFLHEAFRCLKPGGRLSFSVWASPPASEAFSIVLGAVNEAGNPDVPLPDGPPFFRFAETAEAERSLLSTGFTEIVVESVDQLWEVGEAADLYYTFREGTARTRALLEGQTIEEAKAVQASIARRFKEAMHDGSGRPSRTLRMPAVVSSGRKPKEL